jgi:hypothetical protein
MQPPAQIQVVRNRQAWLGLAAAIAALVLALPAAGQQTQQSAPASAPASIGSIAIGPIAIVPIDGKNPDAAATVTGALEVTHGKAMIGTSGSVTSGTETTDVILPRRGVLHVCASTTVKLSSDSSASAGDVPGLMMAMDHGAVEASFATGRDSDVLLTPDFRILIGGPGAADVKVRLGSNGDTCVDNAGVDAPYVLVSSVFEGGAYRVQAGQRVMFQHGSLREVVDQEKEPCGCPPAPTGPNDFPLAQSEGLAPPAAPVPTPTAQPAHEAGNTGTLAYSGVDHAPKPAAPAADTAAVPPAASPAKPAEPTPAPVKKPSFFARMGRFFKKVFGAE